MKPGPWEQRYWERVNRRAADECWPWTAGKTKAGYGRFCRDGRDIYATHIALELDGRLRPVGREACHTCDNPSCVNPAHLWWGTTAENALDKRIKGRDHNLSKTHCKRGHPLSGENLTMEEGRRRCRTCHRAAVNRCDAKRRERTQERKAA